MLVYGDHIRATSLRAQLDRLQLALDLCSQTQAGLGRHSAIVNAFIEAGELHQGLADADFALRGHDHDGLAQRAALGCLIQISKALGHSWDSGFVAPWKPLHAPARRLLAGAPRQISCRRAEGHAYYAVYPEAYYEAAGQIGASEGYGVLGLRSIGAGLAAIAAAALNTRCIATARPTGPPFERRLVLSRMSRKRLADRPGWVIVDEGPGLSGSSFAAARDAVRSAGIDPANIVIIPSHEGSPGSACPPGRAAAWSASRRVCRDFDAVSLQSRRGAHRLETWVQDLTGPLAKPLNDISGGAWRGRRRMTAPANPALERRKFLATGPRGEWLLKFAGLGRAGVERLERAQILATHGFSPPVAGLRHGFLVQAWLAQARPPDAQAIGHERLVERLASYITLRSEAFPAGPYDGATLIELATMARANLAESGMETGAALEQLAYSLARAKRSTTVHVDGRMHAWEWLSLPGRPLLKADAIDHSQQHDLVGCQDPAWDVVGASVEFDLTAAESADLRRRVELRLGRPFDRHLLSLYRVCYPAFQLGLWTLGGALDAAQVLERYRRALAPPALSGDAEKTS